MQDSEIIEGLLRKTLVHLEKHKVKREDPGDEIGPEAPGSPKMGLPLGTVRTKRQVEAVPPAELASLVVPPIVDVCSVRA
jgi:hypothetical protein